MMSSEQPNGRPINRIPAIIFYVAIAGAPLPFGSRDATTIALWCFVLGIGLAFASPRHLNRRHKTVLGGLAFLVLCYAFILHEQLADHPWIAQPHPIWAKTSELLGHPVAPSVSVVRGEPFYALGPSLACLLMVTLGLVIGADRARAEHALVVVAWSGVVYAIYGVLTLIFGPLWLAPPEHVPFANVLTGTFINRNTAAAFFGSCAAIWLVLLLIQIRRRLPHRELRWRDLKHVLAENNNQSALILPFTMYFICLSAMFMTGSRAGVLLSLFVMALTFVIFFRRDLPRGKSLIVVAFGAVAVALILLQLLGGQVEARIDARGLADQGRWNAYKSTLRIIGDNPWFGIGLGNFPWVFPAYRSGDISIIGIWDIAHSTPLELAAEMGLPMAALIGLAWLIALAVLVAGARRPRRETIVPLAVLAVALIGVLHSCVDFSLQVAGYAIVVFGLLGVGLGQSLTRSEPRAHRRLSPRVQNLPRKETAAS